MDEPTLSSVPGSFKLDARRAMLKAVMQELPPSSSSSSAALFKSLTDVRWLMATLGECFDQELGESELINQGIALYTKWFSRDVCPAIEQERDAFLVEMVGHLCKVLKPITVPTITSKQHLDSARDAIGLMLTTIRDYPIKPQAWDKILTNLLTVSIEITQRDLLAPVGDPNIPPLGAEDTYPGEIAPDLLSLVLEAMVRSGTREMLKWNMFVNKVVRKLQKRPKAILRVCCAMESVSAAIVAAHYPIDSAKFISLASKGTSDLVDQYFSAIVSNAMLLKSKPVDDANNNNNDNSSGDGSGERSVRVLLNAQDPKTEVVMRLTQLHDLWRILLALPGDATCVAHPESFNYLAHSAQRIAALLLRVRSALSSPLPYKLSLAVPDSVSAFDIVGPYLFRCTDRSRFNDLTADGVAKAYAGLCDLFYTQRSSDRPIPHNMRLAFFHALHRALSQLTAAMQPVVQTILIHSPPLFTLGFDGVSFLIPTLLSQLHAMLILPDAQFSNPTLARLVRTRAVSLIGSFVGLPQSCNGLELPFDLLSKDSPVWTMMRDKELSVPAVRSSLRTSSDVDDKRNNDKSRSYRFGFSRSNRSGDKGAQEALPNPTPVQGTLISNSIECVSWIACNILKKALLLHTNHPECQQQMVIMLAVLALEDVERDSDHPLAIHVLQFLANFITDKSLNANINTYTTSLCCMAMILEIDDIQFGGFDIAYNTITVLAPFMKELLSPACPLLLNANTKPAEWLDLVCTGLAYIADAMSLPHGGSPQLAVEVALVGMSYAQHDRIDKVISEQVRNASRACLAFIINPLPPCEPWVCRQPKSNTPVLFAGCLKSNTILALSETVEGVRLVMRSEIGEFALLAQPLWETQSDQELRVKSERNPFVDKPWVPPTEDQGPIDDQTRILQDAIRNRFIENFTGLFSDPSSTLVRMRDQILKDTLQSHRVGQDVEYLSPASPVGPNTTAQDPAGNHLSRLFLSSVGGLSPVVSCEPTVCLLKDNKDFQNALHEIDHSLHFRRTISVGIRTDGELDKDFNEFFLSLGKRDTSLPDSENTTRVWVTRRHCVVFSNRSITGSAVDSVNVQWSVRRPTDDMVELMPNHIFVHQLQPKMFLLRCLNNASWPIKDLMIVSDVSLGPLLRWTSIILASEGNTPYHDDLLSKRDARIAQVIREFKSDQDFVTLMAERTGTENQQ